MKKFLTLIFTLVSLNCFAVEKTTTFKSEILFLISLHSKKMH